VNGANDAIVVGGGWAGVAAALSLADAGQRVVLLEARRTWGGRATSWPDPRLGDPVDNGQHVFLGCYAATRALLQRLGTDSLVAFQDGLELEYREIGGRASRLAAPAALGRAGLALGLARWTRVPLAERIALARALLDAPPPPPGSTVTRWLDTLGAAGGPTVRRFFWQPLTEAAINEPPARAPAALLHATVVRAFRGTAADAALGLARAGLGELVAPVVAALAERGGLALLSQPVARVASAPGGHRVMLEDGRTFTAPRLVLAVPAAEARALVADTWPDVAHALDAAAAVPTSPIVTVTLWYDRPVLGAPVVGLVAPPAGGGPGFHWAFDRAALVGVHDGRHAVTLVASAARGLAAQPVARIVEAARAALAAYRITTAVPLDARVVKEPRATPSYDAATLAARPPVATGCPGLAVAGDWTASELPATIEAAVCSGRAAAAHVLSFQGGMQG
jgi:squalene-associated FAD-dependent desaturase